MKELTGVSSGGISAALIKLNPALKSAFEKLYGYTSGKNGIRHPLIDETTDVGYAEAQYMLVTCSAIVSYIIEKARVNGILS
jgi:hypothetical protein